MRRRLAHLLAGLAVLSAGAVAVPPATAAPRAATSVAVDGPGRGGDPNAHLAEILERSPAPDYRRFGSPGMAAAADHAADVLAAAGLEVVRHDVASTVYSVDYAAGHAPSLVRVADGRSFRAESAFNLERTTSAEGLECTVRAVADVGPGDCGFVPFPEVSPEWKNVAADPAGAVRKIVAQGGVGAVLQGDLARGALVALKLRFPVPSVVALADAGDVVGQRVRLRAMGGFGPATLHNVVAVRPPTDPSLGYVVLQGHLDAWFAGAADNGAGAAAVLAGAERLAGDRSGRGLLVALYDGEEWGLVGSEALVATLRSGPGLARPSCGAAVHLEDLVAVVNLDAPAAIASDALGAIPAPLDRVAHLVSYRVLVASAEPTVATLLTATMTGAGALGLPVPADVATALNSGMKRTDGRWFDEAGVPVAWPVAGYPEYHTEADRTETVDPTDLVRVTDGAVALVRALYDAPVGRIPGSSLGAPGSRSTVAAPCAGVAGAGGAEPVATTVLASDGRPELPLTGGRASWALPVVLAVAALALRRLGRQPASS